ncbi:hypothetical protein BGZ94_008994 [Podila epigama]|nr:hypothetical protein BGZ94_008994 [Podila epigama]
MSSARPASVRVSARQSAIQQQQQQQRELEQREREQHQLQETLKQEASGRTSTRQHPHDTLDHSSRSLSPALSESSSLSDSYQSHHADSNEPKTTPLNDPDLAAYWEIALVYGFLVKFKHLLRQCCPLREYSIEDLEAGILASSSNSCIENIHSNLLSNLLNRKKAIDSSTWHKVLLETLDAKQKTGEWEMDNPLRMYGDYYAIPPRDRVLILKSLVEWVLQEAANIRQGLEEYKDEYSVEPFGTDQSKRVYWYFGGKFSESAGQGSVEFQKGTLRLYRESASKTKNATWETVAKDLDGLKVLAASFEKSVYKAEKALRERILTEIVEPMEEGILRREKKHERAEKRLQKLAMFHQMAATRTTRTRSSNRINQPKYTFDDDDEDEEDEYELYRRPSSRKKNRNGDNEDYKDLNETNNHDTNQQRSATPPSHVHSRRSSVDRDSDVSISTAFQRTSVKDGTSLEHLTGMVKNDDPTSMEYNIEGANGAGHTQNSSSPSGHEAMAPQVQNNTLEDEDVTMQTLQN